MSHARRGPNIRTLGSSSTHTIQAPTPAPYIPLQFPPAAAAPIAPSQEIAELRHRMADQSQRIDTLTRSLEALVVNYREVQEELKRVREGQKKNADRIEENVSQVKKVSNNNKKLEQRVGELDHKASVAYINSTADDDARQFMYDERHMTEDDTPLTHAEVQSMSERVQSSRSNRRPGARRY